MPGKVMPLRMPKETSQIVNRLLKDTEEAEGRLLEVQLVMILMFLPAIR
jgi:hypothetical protein